MRADVQAAVDVLKSYGLSVDFVSEHRCEVHNRMTWCGENIDELLFSGEISYCLRKAMVYCLARQEDIDKVCSSKYA